MKSNRMVIYIGSPNSYHDVFEVYYKCLKTYFPDCPYEVVLSTNSQSYEGITVFNNNLENDTWIDRTIPVLNNIDTEYVLVMNDDTFFSERVDVQLIEEVLDEMDSNGIDFCNLSLKLPGKTVSGTMHLKYVHQRQAYGILLQLGIFRRKYLISLLGNGSKSAVEIEKDLLIKTSEAPDSYFDNVVSCNSPIIHWIHGVKGGKWIRSSYKKLQKMGIAIDSDREILSASKEISYKLRRGIGTYFPPTMRVKIKKIMKRFGSNFDSDY